MLQTPAIRAWESVLQIQAVFWKGLADYANSRGAADRRQRVLVEQALNAAHILKLASQGQDTREDWLPMRNAAELRPSAKFVVEVRALSYASPPPCPLACRPRDRILTRPRRSILASAHTRNRT